MWPPQEFLCQGHTSGDLFKKTAALRCITSEPAWSPTNRRPVMVRVNLSPSVQQRDWRCCSETGSYVHPTLGSNSPPSFRHAVITGVHPPHAGNRCAPTAPREQVHTHHAQGIGVHPSCPGNGCAPTMPREQVCTHHTQGTGVCPPHPGKSPLHTSLPIEKTMEHPAGENTAPLVLLLVMSTISAEHRAASAAGQAAGKLWGQAHGWWG